MRFLLTLHSWDFVQAEGMVVEFCSQEVGLCLLCPLVPETQVSRPASLKQLFRAIDLLSSEVSNKKWGSEKKENNGLVPDFT